MNSNSRSMMSALVKWAAAPGPAAPPPPPPPPPAGPQGGAAGAPPPPPPPPPNQTKAEQSRQVPPPSQAVPAKPAKLRNASITGTWDTPMQISRDMFALSNNIRNLYGGGGRPVV